jgi:soluble lytic murein transglycosylase
MRQARRSRARAGRRRLLRLAVLLVVVLGIVIAGVWIAAARAVVPGVSAKLYPIHYRESIGSVAERYGLDPYLVAAVVQTESGYDPKAVSPVGAVGLMQLMPDTAAWITGLGIWQGDDDPELTDAGDNLELGACYLAFLVESFGGQTRVALAAYNAGQGTVAEWVAAVGDPKSFGLEDIQFPETREFVERVEYYWELYARVHPDAFAGAGGVA